MLNANLVTQFSGEVMFKNKRKKVDCTRSTKPVKKREIKATETKPKVESFAYKRKVAQFAHNESLCITKIILKISCVLCN